MTQRNIGDELVAGLTEAIAFEQGNTNGATIKAIPAKPGTLTIRQLQASGTERSTRWHDGRTPWTLLEWAGAMCGEAGETANVAKKLRRLEQGIRGNEHFRADEDERTALIQKLGAEIADTILYCERLATEAGLDLEDIVRNTFNAKSETLGFPDRL